MRNFHVIAETNYASHQESCKVDEQFLVFY
jgi:hypothetical protein